MKRFLQSLMVACLSFAMVGCYESEDPVGPDVPVVDGITLSQEQMSVGADDGEYSVDIYTEYAFRAGSNVDWIEISGGSCGAEYCTQYFNVKANDTTSPREGVITFFCDDFNLTATLTVVQEAGSEQGSGSSIPNNQIWYTSTNGAVVKPYATDVFGANIVSNTYENGQGVIKFDAPVTLIGEAAFCYCETLKSITIPDSVTEIGKEAFTVCTSLTMFYGKFASKDGRCLIVDGVLNSFAIGCGVTEYVIPDSVTSIGYCAFYGCTSLKSVTIPDGVIEIGEGAFVGLISLTSVTIPKSVTKIGWQAFQDCTSITRVNISDLSAWCKIDFAMNIPIGDRLGDSNPLSIAIDGNTQLFLNGEEVVDLIIPYDVTQINVDTFMGCSSINTVVLHSGVKVVNTGAFSWCANLSRVYCWAIHPPIGGGDMFFKTDSDLTIYVPTASVNEYKISAYWDIYKNCIVGYDFPL